MEKLALFSIVNSIVLVFPFPKTLQIFTLNKYLVNSPYKI